MPAINQKRRKDMEGNKMRLIGSGAFSSVFRKDNSPWVYIKTNDPVKECMANGWFPNSRLFPKINKIDHPQFQYKMKYYSKKRSLKNSLKPKEYQKYLDLVRLYKSLHNNMGYYNLYVAFKTIKNRTLRQHLLSAVDSLANYGTDISFEISPRNVVASPTGNLILLDCFYMCSLFNMLCKNKRRI